MGVHHSVIFESKSTRAGGQCAVLRTALGRPTGLLHTAAVLHVGELKQMVTAFFFPFAFWPLVIN